MLNLTNLRLLLAQALSTGGVETAALLTPEGQLVSFAAEPPKSKDEVRVLVGLSSEIWQESRDQGLGMADSEVSCRAYFLATLAEPLLVSDWSHIGCPRGTCSQDTTGE